MALQNGSDGSDGGVILEPPVVRISASKRWCFTYFYVETQSIDEVKNFLGSNGSYIFGLEICPETGRPHMQGYVEFTKKARPLEFCRDVLPKAHWEKTKRSREENIRYCSKENNYFSNFKIRKPLYDVLEHHIKKPFQEELINIVKEDPDPMNRNIYWIYEEEGNTGKTTFAKHVCINRPNEVLFLSGKSADIKNAVCKFLENPDNELKVAIFGFTRSMEDYISYEAIEAVKDGIFFSGKYESQMTVYNAPHIICFANFEPARDALSLDRWIIRKIKKNGHLEKEIEEIIDVETF